MGASPNRRKRIDDAAPRFADAHALPGAGVLFALPFLVTSGVFVVARKVYGEIGPAFYGLRTTLLVLLLMALWRIKRPAALKEHDARRLGRVLDAKVREARAEVADYERALDAAVLDQADGKQPTFRGVAIDGDTIRKALRAARERPAALQVRRRSSRACLPRAGSFTSLSGASLRLSARTRRIAGAARSRSRRGRRTAPTTSGRSSTPTQTATGSRTEREKRSAGRRRESPPPPGRAPRAGATPPRT